MVINAKDSELVIEIKKYIELDMMLSDGACVHSGNNWSQFSVGHVYAYSQCSIGKGSALPDPWLWSTQPPLVQGQRKSLSEC